MSSLLALKEWKRFQHYTNRDPPWVKFYRDTLSSESWVLGTDDSRLVQAASILLAARYQNAIPLDYPFLKKVAHLEMGEKRFLAAIDHLIRTNFLEIQSVLAPRLQDASNTLAPVEESRERAEKSRAEREGAEAPLALKGPAVGNGRRRSRRAPEDFEPDVAHARAELPDIDAEAEVRKLRDHEFKTPRSDWPAVWRTWIATCKESGRYARVRAANGSTRKSAADLAAEARARGENPFAEPGDADYNPETKPDPVSARRAHEEALRRRAS